METVTIHTAKTTLSQLLARVEAGEEIVLARGKQPIAKIVPYRPDIPKRQFGALRGVVSVGPAFFEPLPDDELAAWGQSALNLLLDTHAFLWWIAGDPALSMPARSAIEDAGNHVFVSAASAWEIATKIRIGKLPGATAIAAGIMGVVTAQGFGRLPACFPARTRIRSTGC